MSRFALTRAQWIAIVESIALLVFATGVIQPLSISYATEVASNPVSDIILSNIPVFDMDMAFVYGTFLLFGYVSYLCIRNPRRMPFLVNTFSLFVLIRSVFVMLTHVGPYVVRTTSDFGPTITHMFFGADFFFSGHTGTPFLFALIFWREPTIRWIFLIWSVSFATIVLLGHLHYSIDVAGAYFITYSIYHLAIHFFKKSREWFLEDDRVEKKEV